MGLLTFYVIAAICLVALPSVCSAFTWKDIDGAFMHGNRYLYLFSGDWVARLYQKKQTNLYPKKASVDFDIQAVSASLNSPYNFFYYGNNYGRYFFIDRKKDETIEKKFRYKYAFLKNGGPDAAARRAGKIYFFKGCMMAVRKRSPTPQNMSTTLGLPCDIHAAWQETDGATVLLKGQQFWRWELDGSINGPRAFLDSYHIDRLEPDDR